MQAKQLLFLNPMRTVVDQKADDLANDLSNVEAVGRSAGELAEGKEQQEVNWYAKRHKSDRRYAA